MSIEHKHKVLSLLNSYYLVPRYVYANKNKTEFLIQAGGCGGVDSALIHLTDKAIYRIEFKEQHAQATTADLPKYGADGNIVITYELIRNYPYYEDMLNEQKNLNFFDTMGHNIYAFSSASIRKAIINNYNTTKKYADVIVTADKYNHLVMLPANQVNLFARLAGEIRGGRNNYRVWTPKKLVYFIRQLGGKIDGNNVSIDANRIVSGKPRGGAQVFQDIKSIHYFMSRLMMQLTRMVLYHSVLIKCNNSIRVLPQKCFLMI